MSRTPGTNLAPERVTPKPLHWLPQGRRARHSRAGRNHNFLVTLPYHDDMSPSADKIDEGLRI